MHVKQRVFGNPNAKNIHCFIAVVSLTNLDILFSAWLLSKIFLYNGRKYGTGKSTIRENFKISERFSG